MEGYFKKFLMDIDIPEGFRNKILKDAFRKHYLYTHMPLAISGMVKEKVNERKLIQLSFYSYLYLLVILVFDKFIDNQLDTMENKRQIITYIYTIKEKAILGLSGLFTKKSEFWTKFNELKKIYFKYADSSYLNQYENINDNIYLDLAKGKGILIYNYVYAIKYLFGDIDNMDELLSGIDYFNIGFQIFDDYKDVREDYKNNQPNYILFKITGNDVENKHSLEYLLKRAYLNNTISDGLNIAISHLTVAKEIFENLKSELLLEKTVEIMNFINSELYFIKASILKARDKSKKNNVVLRQNDINSTISLSLDFLENNLDENYLWKDFLTNAGYGKEWITGYVLSMIGEIDNSIPFLNKPLNVLLHSKGSYNDYIVQDGDSTNFLVRSLYLFNHKISKEIITDWLKFSKENGGWTTYYSDDIKGCMNFPLDSDFSGWFSSKFCVSAVSAWIMKDVKTKIIREKYTQTLDFLVSNQNTDGSWTSYWWTENLYATAFSILAIPENNLKILQKASSYISDKQNSNGSWNNEKTESSFYTALSLKALIHYYLNIRTVDDQKLLKIIQNGINWLLANQMSDGSWDVTRILRIPSPEIADSSQMEHWGHTSFGLNCLVDDHNRVFTTATAFNTLSLYAKYF